MTAPGDSAAPPRARLDALPCFQLYLGWRRAQAYYRPLLEQGLNPQRMYVLELLDEHGELGVGALARALDVDPGTISGLLSRMEREELVVRRRSSANRLEVRVRATRAGRARHRRLAAAIEQADRRLLAELEPGSLAGLTDVVRTLARLSSPGLGAPRERAEDGADVDA